MKELWIQAHEELIEEYLDIHPDASDKEAEQATLEYVDDRLSTNLCHLGEMARARMEN